MQKTKNKKTAEKIRAKELRVVGIFNKSVLEKFQAGNAISETVPVLAKRRGQ